MNRPEEIEDLVRNGADINKKDASGRTPLDMCALTKGVKPPHGGKLITAQIHFLLTLFPDTNRSFYPVLLQC